MPDHMSSGSPLLLLGAGPMAVAYAKVLRAQDRAFHVIGRGEASAAAFEQETGIPVATGVLADCLQQLEKPPETVIIAVASSNLAEVTRTVIEGSAKRILVEKPGALFAKEVEELADIADAAGTEVFIAYNRRFHASTAKARDIIAQDGGVVSVKFDFTELSRRIAANPRPRVEFETWLFGNSSHVIDLAFHLAGQPEKLSASVSGALDWHPDGAVFVGHGTTETGALFAYHADWLSPGRWGVEIMTRERRLILQPLELLFEQTHDSFALNTIELEDELDKSFKPGVYRQVEAFLDALSPSPLPTIREQAYSMRLLEAIAKGRSLER